MPLEDLFSTYFIDPLVNRTGQYNPVNTVTYAVILFFASYILYEKVLKKRVAMDKKFAFAFISFTVFASGIHVLEDMKVISSNFLVSPLIQAWMYGLFLVLFPLSLLVQNRTGIEYWKTLSSVTLVPSAAIVLFIFSRSQNFAGLVYVIVSFIISVSVLHTLRKKFPSLLSKENFSVLSAHMLDASSTFVSIAFFGYREQHVLPTFLIGAFGPVVMFPLKLAVIAFVLYAFDREIQDKNLRTFFKILVLILGLAPGLRDTLRLTVPA